MKHSIAIVNMLEENGKSPHYWEDDVLARSTPDIVSHVYREHVEVYLAFERARASTRTVWYKASTWLRRLERRCHHRLFTKEPQMDPVWWGKHVRAIVSRRATSIRLTLPLEDEIKIFMDALRSHFIAWILGLVDLKRLELSMYPKTLLNGIYVQIRQHGDFHQLALQTKELYPDISRPIIKQEFDESFYPTRLSHWPGLRIRPPFFPDLAAFYPAPSTTLPYQGMYLVISASLQDAVAKACILDCKTAMVDDLRISNQPFNPPLALRLDDQEALEAFLALDQTHPRSFRYNDPRSPYATAATVLTPRISLEASGAVGIPENALLEYELGFSFTYMTPVTDGYVPALTKEEQFYEVNLPSGDCVHLSSFVGFGLRIRHTILTHAKPHEIRGHGVCIVVPDGLSPEITENIMLTCIAFLQGLGLKDLKLLSEAACHVACLGSVAALRECPNQTSWASFHDGPLVCQALAVLHRSDDNTTRDLWKVKYNVQPLKNKLLAHVRDYILGHSTVAAAVDKLVNNRFAGRAAIIEAIRTQLPQFTDHFEEKLWDGESTSITLHLTGSAMASITLDVRRATFEEWLQGCFVDLVEQPWWEELQHSLTKCTGVLVSGGIFDCCPRTALRAFHNILTPGTKEVTKRLRINMLHGACMVIYREKGCTHLFLSIDDSSGLPIPVSK
jgi:hypothetical protein